jgi:hypothetical protein
MQSINNKTAFEKTHFDDSTVRVVRNGLTISRIIGVDLDDAQIIGLAGAPKGSTVQLLFKQSWTPAEVEDEAVPPGLYFIVTEPAYIRTENWVGIFRESENKLGIYLKLIDFHPGRIRGLAARMIARIVRTTWGIPEIATVRLFAAGGRSSIDLDPNSGERWGGFVAWPTYGFDMELLPETIAMAPHFPYSPRGLASCRFVRDVLKLTGGRDYWKLVGDGDQMEFDPGQTSDSIATLDAYLMAQGL